MPSRTPEGQALAFHPLTSERWKDLETLFGARGACGGCWCMWWRLRRSEFQRQKGQANKESMRSLVAAGEVPGILAYAGQEPVGWCAVAPRESYPVLERSRVLRRVDDRPVWSVTCLFVRKEHRHKGISVQLLRAAVAYVKEQGGTMVEGYPVEAKTEHMPAAFAWTGVVSAFEQAGFSECARGSPTRPIMRFEIET
jgi:GNAT superfamily N-acetyltransferase